jgi:hypothetical protein
MLGVAPNSGDGQRPGRLGFRFEKKLEQKRKKSELGFVHELLYGAGARLASHTIEQGEVASVEEKRSTTSCCPPCVKKG